MAARSKSGSRVQVDELRVAMTLLGADVETIAAEIARRYGHRPRAAWRLAHGWDQPEATARYNALVHSRGERHRGHDTMTPARVSDCERWPRSPRRPSPYVLSTFAKLYGTSVVRLLDHEDLAAMSAAERAALIASAGPGAPAVGTMDPAPAHRRTVRGGSGTGTTLEELLSAAANESTQAALDAAASNVGPGTLDGLRQRIGAVVADAEHVAPAIAVGRAVLVRDDTLALLSGKHLPDQAQELHAVVAEACALLGWMSGDLGQHYAATSQVAAAWTFAEIAKEPGTAAAVRAAQAKVRYWAGDVAGSARYAAAGLREISGQLPGTVGVLLASMLARAAARLGQADTARAALDTVTAERDRVGDMPGGLISCGLVGQHCFAAGALLTLGDPACALAEVDEAERAYRVDDPHGRGDPATWGAYRSVSMARVTGIAAYLTGGDLDGAGEQMRTLSALPADRRVATLGQRLGRAVTLLRQHRYAGEPRAAALQEEIIEFRRSVPTVQALHAGRR
jgi:hypothetical protein